MSDDTARALGAGGTTVKIGGKECSIRPLKLRELAELNRECLKQHKRDVLQHYKDTADIMGYSPEDLEKKNDAMSEWTLDDLPDRKSIDPGAVIVTDELKRWLIESIFSKTEAEDQEEIAKIEDAKWARLAVAALEKKMLTDEKFEELTKLKPVRVRVDYVSWWITTAHEGKVAFLWKCFQDQDVSKEDIEQAMQDNMALMTEVARELGLISTPAVGNG